MVWAMWAVLSVLSSAGEMKVVSFGGERESGPLAP